LGRGLVPASKIVERRGNEVKGGSGQGQAPVALSLETFSTIFDAVTED
jgi:hypothetical protein